MTRPIGNNVAKKPERHISFSKLEYFIDKSTGGPSNIKFASS